MRPRRHLRRGLPGAVGAVIAVAGALSAQAPPTLTGQVVDTAGAPVADQTVVLHRVTGAGGSAVARSVTDASGRFSLDVPTDEDGVLFAATRLDGALYIGATFRPASVPTGEYRIEVGGPSAVAGLGPADATGPVGAPAGAAGSTAEGSGSGSSWWIGGGAIAAAVLLLLIAWRVQARPPEARRLLRDLAVLEERHASADAGRDDAYRDERDALRRRLEEIARA